jgi:O-antigen ligase
VKATRPVPVAPAEAPWRRLFGALFGAFLGLTLLKFGNPPIFEQWVSAPTNAAEFLLGCPWPIGWAYAGLAVLLGLGLFAARPVSRAPVWLVVLPLVWFAWNLAAGSQSVDAQLSRLTLFHFAACGVCFYLGYFCLGQAERLTAFWVGLAAGFLLVFASGIEQHFGGLEQTRRYFFAYLYPQMTEVPAEYLKKMSSDRVFSTLFYPNAFAGVILLLLPALLSLIARARERFTPAARGFLLVLAFLAAVACLVWSGSKGGWLLLLGLSFVALLRLSFDRRVKVVLVCGLLLTGLTAFGWKYASFFQKGATSVVARFDYWQAALRTANAHPVFGTGPGTFAKSYATIKRPESEMARLVHNDYLEQASDSGWLGFLGYSAFIGAGLYRAYPRRGAAKCSHPSLAESDEGWLVFAVWLGVLGWAIQGLFEFGLYIPALAWPAFTFLGVLLNRDSSGVEFRMDKEPPET